LDTLHPVCSLLVLKAKARITVIIRILLPFLPLTLCALIAIRVPSVSREAVASTLVVLSSAVSIDGTPGTWVYTLLLPTSQGNVTIRVHQTLIGSAFKAWVASVIGRAYAMGSVTACLTNGIGTTFFKEARILAFSIDASLVISAFKVTLATS